MNFVVRRNDVDLNTVVSLPLAYTPGTGPWPVLCFLHGRDEAAPLEINAAITRHGPLRPGSSQRVTDFIVVAPQLPAPGGDVWQQYAPAVQEIVRAVQVEYAGNANRTYLTGFSFGGNGVFRLALTQSNFWAASWAVDPPAVPSGNPQRPVSLCLGQYSRGAGWEKYIQGLRQGQAAQGANGNLLINDRGNDHVRAAELAYSDDNVYVWLGTKQLP